MSIRTISVRVIAAAGLIAGSPAIAAEPEMHHEHAPDDHAPAGVMSDHMHAAGEFMIGYRYMFDYSGGRTFRGRHEISDAPLAEAGFSSTPERMAMSMHMLDIMYAPADWLTLMLMPQYMTMDMRMRDVAGAGGGHGRHGGHGGHAGPHEHGTSGIADTIFSALIRLHHANGHHVHAGLGLSAPTGSVSERDAGGVFTHYMMQLGSGTWDALPSLTYSANNGLWGWGGQFSAHIRLEDENDSGFRFGDRYQATAWVSRRLAEWLSASARVAYSVQGDISGHYNGPHNHSSPPDLQANYGGRVLELGVGLNALAKIGNLAGNRLGVEAMLPVHQDVNGIQEARDVSLFFVWSQAL